MVATIKLKLQWLYRTLKISMSLNFYHHRRKLDPIVNNEYYDDEGKTAYMVHTPASLHRTTTISKALYDSSAHFDSLIPPRSHSPRVDALNTDSEQGNESASEGEEGFDSVEEDLEEGPSTPIMSRRGSGSSGQHNNFIYLAQIEWGVRAFKGSKIRFGTGQYSGREVMVKDLFRQEGWNGR